MNTMNTMKFKAAVEAKAASMTASEKAAWVQRLQAKREYILDNLDFDQALRTVGKVGFAIGLLTK